MKTIQVNFFCFIYLPGGRDFWSFSAFSASSMTNVYKYLEHRSLNFTFEDPFFLIRTANKNQMDKLRIKKIKKLELN